MCQCTADGFIGERDPWSREKDPARVMGLRSCWRCSREAWGSVAKPGRRDRVTARDMERSSLGRRKLRRIRDGSDDSGNELAERAVVVLVNTRAARMLMIFRVRPNCRRRRTTGRGCIDDADYTRQRRLPEGNGEDPATNNS